MSSSDLPEWDEVLSAAARLQGVLPDAVLVGGTASAIYAKHRMSTDADHVLTDLRERFDAVLGELESVAGWQTARVRRPVLILGSLDGIETGVRQLIRSQPLETTHVDAGGRTLTIPTRAEILRIKGALILRRNATRDYLDFVALASGMGEDEIVSALARFDELYPQPGGQSPLQQLKVQLCKPLPFDLDQVELAEYKRLDPRWHDWATVEAEARRIACLVFERITGA